MKRVLLFALGLFIVSTEISYGQRLTPKTSFVLNLDYARFLHNDTTGYVEIYYAFYPRLVTYTLSENKFLGYIRLRTRIMHKATNQYYVSDRAVLPLAVSDTSDRSLNDAFVTQAGYALPHGEYVLSVFAVDSLDQTRGDSLTLSLSLSSYATGVRISDIELCSSIKNSDQKGDPFYKNGLEVIPNPSLVFGATTHPVVFTYSELYNLDKEATYTTKARIVDVSGKTVKEASNAKKYGVPNAVDVGTLIVTSLSSGRYRLQTFLTDGKGIEFAKAEKTFFVYNPHIKVSQVSAASMKASELAGLSAVELADEFRKAQYLATDQEVKTFAEIQTEDGRREFLARFWTDVEPGRFGKNPIKRSEYLERVNVADRRYRVMAREGWRTDRGRVFILYGEPDEIERQPSSQGSKPYEIWHFYQIETGILFVFVDRSGFNDYILVHSTKRGELRDDSWQRYLR